MVVIGIDLGTTHSCVAVFQNGRPEVFENDHGSRTTPSYVAFTDVDFFVGTEAKVHTAVDPSNTVFDAKRLIGRTFTDEYTQEDIRHWPFLVVNDNGKPTIEVSYLNEKKQFIPEAISSMVLQKLKELAEDKLGETVTDAVITVPAYFNDSQRQATKDAATIAGLKVLKLVNEPTAAAIAFTLNNRDKKKSNILVYDLGGGTFDVSIVCIENGNIEVKAVNGDTHLGGNDFDNKLLDYFLDEIKTKFNKDLRKEGSTKSISRLKNRCELIKISLSGKKRLQANLEVDALFDGQDFKSVLTRAKFDEICDELMRKTLIPVQEALSDAKLEKESIDEVLLVGGSTRILKIQNLVQEFFGVKKLNRSINPEEAVACGAAIQAALLEESLCEEIADIKLRDVTPLSYGIAAADGSMSVIIPRNTPYPTILTKRCTTIKDNQNAVLISVYQGERCFVNDNYFLGHFSLWNLPEKKAGEVKVDTAIEVDKNGILVVTAIESSTGVTANIKITSATERLSENTIKTLFTEAMRSEELKLKTHIKAKNELSTCIDDLTHTINEDNTRLRCSSSIKKKAKRFLDKTLQWIADNPEASTVEIEDKLQFARAHRLLLNSSEDNCRTS